MDDICLGGHFQEGRHPEKHISPFERLGLGTEKDTENI